VTQMPQFGQLSASATRIVLPVTHECALLLSSVSPHAAEISESYGLLVFSAVLAVLSRCQSDSTKFDNPLTTAD